jgi:hypothetical protein
MNDIFINKKTLDFPIYIGDILRLYPDIVISDNNFQLPEEFEKVNIPESPSLTENQYLIETKPELIDGIWTYKYQIGELPERIEKINVPNITPEILAQYHTQNRNPSIPTGKRKIFATEATGRIDVTVIKNN